MPVDGSPRTLTTTMTNKSYTTWLEFLDAEFSKPECDAQPASEPAASEREPEAKPESDLEPRS
jgi:hypothetical protein